MAWRIAFGDLKIGEVARKYINRALDKHWVSEGENVAEFEQRFADMFGYEHAIATSSGTDADICSCAALYERGANRGDEVILPACCFVACANSILAAGLTPKFVDIDIETLNINPDCIEAAISRRTRAIMAVHTMGKPCHSKVYAIARTNNLQIIEDACEAHGASLNGTIVGKLGDMATFSFYTAHLIVCGEGGMVVTESADIASAIRSIKSHGRPPGSLYFDFQRIGFNSKMMELEAAIGLEGLTKFNETFLKRRHNLLKLLELTSGLSEYCYFLKEERNEVIAPHAFSLVLRHSKLDRDRLYRHLESNGIQCKTIFGSLPTQHDAFRFLGYKYGDFPAAEYVGENGLHFGIHQYLAEADLEWAATMLQAYFK